MTREQKQNKEANVFARALLMPQEEFTKDAKAVLNEHAQDTVDRLSELYDVEPIHVIMRAHELGLFRL